MAPRRSSKLPTLALLGVAIPSSACEGQRPLLAHRDGERRLGGERDRRPPLDLITAGAESLDGTVVTGDDQRHAGSIDQIDRAAASMYRVGEAVTSGNAASIARQRAIACSAPMAPSDSLATTPQCAVQRAA